MTEQERSASRRRSWALRHWWWALTNWVTGHRFDRVRRYRCCGHTTPHHYGHCYEEDDRHG